MKYKLKEFELNKDNFTFDKVNFNDSKIINLKYKNDTLEFQTPKVIIDSLIKENNHEYISLKITGNKACEIFCSKIFEMENIFNEKFNCKSIFKEDCFIVKIPFKFSKPLVKVYKKNQLFNYYHLVKGMEIICLLNVNKLWVNCNDECNYNLNVKEIMVI